jgi:catalase
MKLRAPIVALSSFVVFAFATAGFADPVPSASVPVPTQIVDALNKAFGVHPGFRANHAKGVVVEGTFKATAQASKLTTSPIFGGDTLPVTVRFSDSTGLPTIPDGAGGASPHGMAIKFHLAGGAESDLVINSLKFFPVATPEDFRDLLLAVAASPADAPKPTPFDTFVAAHPAVPKAFGSTSTPDSLANEQYNGIDAFVFVDKAGAKQAFRYEMVPEHAVHLDAAASAAKAPNFLMDELPLRVAQGPVRFHLKAQLAAASDSTRDATVAWPDDRTLVDLGVLTLTKPVADSAAAEKKLLFLPMRLTAGIELSDDPLIPARNSAYAVSFSRRSANP